MSTPAISGTIARVEQWQRLAPAAIIYFIVKIVGQVMKQGMQGLLPIFVIAVSAGEGRWFIISAIATAGAAVLITGAFVSYMKFRFRINEDQFLIQSGVFKRKRLTLGFDRIQNVAFKQPVYFRPFGLVVMVIESAGSSGEEVSLGGIPRPLAENIRAAVFERKSSHHATLTEPQSKNGAAATDPTEIAEEIIHQPIAELVRYGLSNSQIWVFAGIAAGALGQIEWDDFWVLSNVREWLDQISGQSRLAAFALVFGGFIGGFLLLLGVSVIGAIVNYYDYHLTRTHGRFHRTNGLFSKHETSLPEVKIQSLVIRQGWPARLLKRFHLQLKQVGFGRQPGQQGGGQGGSTVLIPSVTDGFAKNFSKIIYSGFNWSAGDLKEIDRAFTRKTIFWIMLPIATIPATTLSIAFDIKALVVLLIPFALTPGVMLRRARYGYASDGEHGIVRSGFFGYKLTLFAFYKVQSVELQQSPGQRRKSLATLTVKLAGSSLTIPYMGLQEAENWRDAILFQIESRNKKWM